ncbi:MAG TPA: hypothetical protein PKN70_09850 [Smithellaceae bacterium]|nr:hypothetical protein [Smithellaceae bacterium]
MSFNEANEQICDFSVVVKAHPGIDFLHHFNIIGYFNCLYSGTTLAIPLFQPEKTAVSNGDKKYVPPVCSYIQGTSFADDGHTRAGCHERRT